MSNNPNNLSQQPNKDGKEPKKIGEENNDTVRQSYILKRSPIADVFAGVVCVLLALAVWFFAG